MAAILPQERLAQIQFCETHIPAWADAPPTAIGLDDARVASLAAATAAARAGYDRAVAARQASLAATTEYHNLVRIMRDAVGPMIASVKAFAEMQPNPDAVHAKAQIPVRAPDAPALPPGRPTNLRVKLEPTGAVTLSWDAPRSTSSTGGVFTVSRKVGANAPYLPVGMVAGSTNRQRRASFTDTAIPAEAAAGRGGVQYIVRGRRGDRVGEASEAITVNFGGGGVGGGGGGVGVIQSGELKMAA